MLIGRHVAKDGGFTSVGVAVALLLVVSLLFTATQVKWIESTSADIQFAADAGALAAQNIVAEYLVLARVADAVVLSMSLFGLALFGIAVVVSCIPYAQGVGAELMNFGRQVFSARDRCAQQAAQALNALQKALPFLCAVNAAHVIQSNRFSPAGEARYLGLAIPLPLTGEETEFADDDQARSKAEDVGAHNEETSRHTDEAARSSSEMDSSKLEGYLADCGSSPGRCLYERVGHLSGLSGAQNPYFSSVESWAFDYAYARAKSYYRERLGAEHPADNSLEEQVKSFARERYFSFAVDEMERGYAHTSSTGVLDACFPLMPRNNGELRETRLYTEKAYPVDSNNAIHGATTCPALVEGGFAGYGSLSQCEEEVYQGCSQCEFDINTVGRVASATSSVDTGFEFHYRKVAAAAERYSVASKEFHEESKQAKESAKEGLDAFEEALRALDTPRLDPSPPGRNGCIAICIDPTPRPIPQPFSSSLVGGDASIQPRIAISAAAMAKDDAREGNTLLAGFLDRAREDVGTGGMGGGVLGAFDQVLGIWGDMLLVYSEGVDSMARGLGDFLRGIPLVNATPLAGWAESALRETIEAVGLQGVDLSTPKPVLVNSLHVARASDSAAAQALVTAKEGYSSVPGSGSGTLAQFVADGLLGGLESQGTELLGAEITLFTISFGDMPGLPSIPVTIALPRDLAEQGSALLSDARRSASSAIAQGGGGHAVWE
jgi:hypothetical protein